MDDKEFIFRRTCQTQDLGVLQYNAEWDTDSEGDHQEESDLEEDQAKTTLMKIMTPKPEKMASILKEWADWDPAPEKKACTNVDKERNKAATARVTEIAIRLREELERKRQKVRKRKEFRKFMTWDNSEFKNFAPVEQITGNIKLAEQARRQNIIIFDWDDTLFPTWYLTEVVQPCSDAKYAKLPEDSMFHSSLAAHAKLVKQILSAASSVAHVYIVTLGNRPWVENSSDWFLPGLDMAGLLKELGIHVYYAREHVKQSDLIAAGMEDGVNAYTIAKRNAMKKCMKRECRKTGLKKVNAIAVGDSPAEMDAIRDVIWDEDADENRCKTVKFLSDPTLQALTSELLVFRSWISPLLAYDKDVDVDMGNPDAKAIENVLQASNSKVCF